jgi:hypothetical protein
MSIQPGSRGDPSSFLSREVEALAVAEFFHNLTVSAPAAFFGTLLCTAVFMEDGLRGAHVAWLAYGTVVAALRLGLCWAIRRQAEFGWHLEPRQWARLAVLGNVLAGIQWGLLGTWLFPEEPGFRQTFTIMVITSFVGGSITAYAPVRWAHPALSIPATVPPMIYVFFVESGPHYSAGATALFFSAMVLYYSFREHRLVVRRLRADTRLRHEIQDLVSAADSRGSVLPPEDSAATRF